MEPIDRKTLKERSKELIRTVQPPVWQVTLIFLLATTVVSIVINLFSPAIIQMNTLYNDLMNAAAQGDMDTASQILMKIQNFNAAQSSGIFMLITVLFTLYIRVVTYGYNSYALKTVRLQESGYEELFSRFYMSGKIILAEVLQTVFVFLWALVSVFAVCALVSILFVPLAKMNASLTAVMGLSVVAALGGAILPIIATYRYRMIPYCLLDDPDCSVMEAFRRSKAMMNGRKGELFVLDLSFLGWELLTVLVGSLATALVGGVIVAMVRNVVIVVTAVSTVATVACYCLLLPYQTLTYAQWYEAIRPQTEEQPEETSNFY